MSLAEELASADAATNKYDALIAGDRQAEAQRLAGTVAVASRRNPDQHAQASIIADKQSVPVDLVARNLEHFSRPKVDYDAIVKNNPKLTKWMGDVDNASMAHDDLEALTELERVVAPSPATGRGFLRESILDQLVGGYYDMRARSTLFDAIDSADKARTGMPSFGELLNKNVAARLTTPEGQAEYQAEQAARVPKLLGEAAAFEARGQEIPLSPEVVAFLDENSGKSVWEAFKEAPAKIIVELGARSGAAMLPGLSAGAALGVAGSVGGPAGATAGFSTGMGVGSARVEYVASVVAGLRKRGINPANQAMLAGALNDQDLMAEVQKEALIRAAVIGGVDAIAGLVGAKNLTPAVKNVVMRELANVGVQMPVQAALGAAGEAGAEVAAGEPLQPRQIAAEAAGEFVTAPIDVAVATFAGTRAELAEGAAKVEAAQNRQRVFEALASTDAKLRARAPERFKSLIEDMTKDGPVETVYIPADRFSSYFQDSNQDAAELLDKMPAVAAQLEEALASGADLAIPMADFATYIAPSDHYKGLSQDLRFNPEDMTAREAEAWKAQAEELQKEAGTAAAEGTGEAKVPGDARVYADVLRQLTETVGMEEGTAKRNATLMASVFGALGHRSGQDPYELYEKYGLKLERGMAKDAIREEARKIADDDNLLAPIIEELKAETAKAAIPAGEIPAETPGISQEPDIAGPAPVQGELEAAQAPVPRAAAPTITAGPAKGIAGGKGRVRIDNEYREVQWAVMDAATLAPTIDKAENQYRDRNRAAGQAQVQAIAQNIDFNQLAGGPLMDYGAPTLAEDGRVVGGNGRLAGIRKAYDIGLGDSYKGPLAERAAEFGLTREDVEAMERPVLVRILPSDVDVRKAAIASNEGGAMQMSALENAKVDAERIGELTDFEFDDNGQLSINRSLVGIRRWVGQLPPQQRGAITDEQGALSAEGVRRLQNAILYRAYGDSPTLARLIDAVDPGSRNIAAALMRAAPAVAELKDGIASGNRYDLDISKDLEAAVEKLIRVRESGQAVEEALRQQDVFGSQLSEESEIILRFMAANLRSSKSIADFLNRYHADAERAGSPQQGDMLGDRVTPKSAEMLARAAAAHEPAMELKASQAALFQAVLEQGPAPPKPWRKYLEEWTPAEGLTPEEKGIEAEFMAWIMEDPERAIAEYNTMDPETHGGEDTDGGKIINADSARELSPVYRADRSKSRAVHEPASALAKALFAKRLAEQGPGLVLFSAGGTGAGKSSGLRRFADKYRQQAHTIYDTNMGAFGSSKKKIEEALAAGNEVTVIYTYRDPLEALEGGALARADRQEKAYGSGRSVPIDSHLDTHLGANATFDQLTAEYGENEKVKFLVIYNDADREKSHLAQIEEIPQINGWEYNALREQAIEIVRKVAAAGGVSAQIAAGFLQSEIPSGRPGARPGDRGQPEKEREGRAQDRTAQELVADAIRESGLDVNTATPQEIREALAASTFEQPQLFQAAPPVQSAAFERWFGESVVVDKAGEPLVVYRGEHGPGTEDLESRGGAISFGTAQGASKYAMSPNDSKDTPVAPRVTPVYLSIEKPVMNDPDDPFIDFATIEKILGREQAEAIALELWEEIRNTNNWEDNFAEQYSGGFDKFNPIYDVLAKEPERLGELYVNAFWVFDRPEWVELFKAKGYDGAVHGGSGETALEPEYKIFDKSQAKSAIGNRGTFDKSSPNVLHQSAFHGSPYEFDRFSTQKIGTGEGAQAYGWGLYFAEEEKVAGGYAKSVVNQAKVNELNARMSELVKEMEPYRTPTYGKFSDPRGQAAFDEYERVINERERIVTNPQGTLYQVDIDDSAVRRMMIGDELLGRQPPQILRAIKKLAPSAKPSWTGFDAYESITKYAESVQAFDAMLEQASELGIAIPMGDFSDQDNAYLLREFEKHADDMKPRELLRARAILGPKNGDQLASEALAELGIPGIKYHDANTRRAVQEPWLVESLNPDGSVAHTLSFKTEAEAQANIDYWNADPERAARIADIPIEEVLPTRLVKRPDQDGTYNFVVFDESAVEITGKNGKPVTAAKRAELMQNMNPPGWETADLHDPSSPGMYQPGKASRGATSFGDDRQFTIRLFETADLSTLLHESGHFYLEVLNDLAAKEPAIAKDFQALLDWFGIEGGLEAWNKLDIEGKRNAHEQFARGFEAYLFEGKAPNPELQSIFARFRAWLVSIYRNLERLNVKVTPEVLAVFDRLVATDDEIAAARSSQAYVDIFTTAEDAGMSETEFGAYRKAVAAARTDAEEKLTQEVLAELKREQKAWWAEERAKVEAEVTAEAHAQPVYRALAFLQKGTNPDGTPIEGAVPVKLNRAAIVDSKGKPFLKELPRPYVYSAEGGVHPDVIAGMFGFESGDSLLIGLSTAKPIRKAISDETDVRMKAKFGDALVDGSLVEKAMDAVHNDRQADLLAAELRGLRKLERQVGPALAARELSEARHRRAERDAMPDRDERRLIAEAAKRAIAQRRIRDINPNVYRVAEARASRLAFEAAAKKDYTTAYLEKRKQLLNHELYRAARDAKLDADKIRDYMRKFQEPRKRASLGRAGQSYLEQIDAIMERFDFSQISNKGADRRLALAAWVEERRKQGLEVNLPEWMLNESVRMPWRNLSYEQLQGVHDAVVNIDHLSRLKNKLLANQAGREFEAEVEAIVDSIDSNHTRKPEPFEFAPSFKSRVAQGMKRAMAEHTKMEFLFSMLDGERDLGPVWTALFKPIADAESQEQSMQRAAREALQRIFGRYSRKERSDMFTKRFVVPGIGVAMNKATLLSVALNVGNEYNREVLLKGYKWTEGQLKTALSQLEDRDWETVQMIWDQLDSYWPEIKRLQQDLTGLAPEKVQAVPFQSPSGRPMAGGYYPIAYDSRLSWRQAELDESQAANELYGGGYMRVQTRHGHTIERTNSGGKAIKLDLSVMGSHIVNVIHDLSHRRAILDVDRLVTDDRVREAIEQTAGTAMYRQLRPWLKAIAADYRPDTTVYEGAMNRLRAGGTIVSMGIKITTAMVQPLGYFQSLELLGPKYAGIGLTEVFGRSHNTVRSISQAREFAFERSEQIRNRMHTFDRDVRDAIKGMTGMGEEQAKLRRGLFFLTGFMDMSVSLPTWLGAYRKAMDGEAEGIPAGDEPKAIDFADSILRRSQSAGGAKDLAGIQGPNPLIRVFTVFYSYFNVLFNLFARRMQMMNFKKPSDYPRFVASMVALWFAPAVLSEIVAGRGPDDDEDWDEYAKRSATTWALYPLQSVAFVRDIVSGMGPFGYDGPPVVEAMATTATALTLPAQAVDEDEEISRAEVKAAVLALGYWGHLPSRQMWITGSYLYDWATGAENPETAAEALEGLAYPRQQQ